MRSMENHTLKKLFVIDFDGTITKVDTLRLVIFLRCLKPKYWMKLVRLIAKRAVNSNVDLRLELQRVLWCNMQDRVNFFCWIFGSQYFAPFINQRLLELLETQVVDNKVLILTANELDLVHCFFKCRMPQYISKIDFLGADYLLGGPPMKGISKRIALQKYIKDQNLPLTIKKHCFFDSISDLELAEICDIKIGIGKYKLRKIRKISYDVLSYDDYCKVLKND